MRATGAVPGGPPARGSVSGGGAVGIFALIKAAAGGQGGNVAVLLAGGMVALCGFGAVSVDAGRAFADRQRLHDVVDAAALAGAAYLPDAPGAGADAALALAAGNGVSDGLSVTFPDSRTIAVEASGSTRLLLAPVLDGHLGELRYRVSSRATVSGVGAIRPRGGVGGTGWDQVNGGAVPLATERKAFTYGESVTLKVGPGDGTGGNFHPLSLGGTGAEAYRQNLERGYAGVMRVGDRFYTEPGNMAGPTKQAVDWRIGLDEASTFDTVQAGSPRLVYVAAVDSFVGADGRTEVVVRGFAAFFLENASGGEITGRFIHWLVPGEPGGDDFGLVTVRLLE